MSDLPDAARGALAGAQAEADARYRDAAPWIERLARAGYAAKGLVYVVVGALAVQAARGGGDVEGSRGALAELADGPGGGLLLGLLVVGLAGYALWRFVQAAADPDGRGSDAEGIGARTLYAVSGAVYVGLCVSAARLLTGRGGEGGGDGLVAAVMGWPAGRWLVVLAALGVAGYGLYNLYRAATADLTERLALDRLASPARRQVAALARAGTAARGVVFAVAGVLAARGAWRYDPEQPTTQDALSALREAPAGDVLLVLVGAGLVAYGLYQLVVARYRTIRA